MVQTVVEVVQTLMQSEGVQEAMAAVKKADGKPGGTAQDLKDKLRPEVAKLKKELATDLRNLRHELREPLAKLRQELQQPTQEMRDVLEPKIRELTKSAAPHLEGLMEKIAQTVKDAVEEAHSSDLKPQSHSTVPADGCEDEDDDTGKRDAGDTSTCDDQ